MPRRLVKVWFAIYFATGVFVLPSIAQDSHYWSHQYGGRANLLTGAVVGRISDASAAYYNPAGIAGATEGEIFLGTQVVDLTNIRIETETGEETTLDSDDLGRAPSFLGGMAPLGLGKHRFAYAVFKRQAFDMRIEGTSLASSNVAGSVDPTLFARNTFDNNLSERWFGGTWAYPVSKTVGIGISTFLAGRQQRLEIERTAQSLLSSGSTAIANDIDYYKYGHYRILWKAGVELDLEQISFGLTVTTPGLEVYSTGERIVNRAESGIGEIDGREDYLAADFQEAVGATYKSPISAALGISMFFERRAIHVTVEAFDSIEPYSVLDLEPAFSQSTNLPIANKVVASADGVVNSAVGLEEFFSEKFRGFLSVSTDYSAAPEEGLTNLSITRWDLYHVTGGATFTFKNAQFIAGLGYSFGGENSTRIAAPPNDNLSEILGDIIPSEIHYRRLKVILGFSLSAPK
jgi:hypothetical protein